MNFFLPIAVLVLKSWPATCVITVEYCLRDTIFFFFFFHFRIIISVSYLYVPIST